MIGHAAVVATLAVLAVTAAGCGGGERADEVSPEAETSTAAGAPGETTSTWPEGSGPAPAVDGRGLCPTVEALNATVGAAATEREVGESTLTASTSVTCRYGRPGEHGLEVAWSIEIQRFAELDDAAGAFAVARRTSIFEETPLPPGVQLGDEAAADAAANDVLLVRRGADVVRIDGLGAPDVSLDDLIAVFELVAADLEG